MVLEKSGPMTTRRLAISITATDRASMDRQLDEAMTVVKARAMRDGRHGILVARHGIDTFTVAISDSVPFGLTREHMAW